MVTLKDLIKDKTLFTVTSGSTVYDAITLMAENKIGLVPVLKGKEIAGVFSERDLLTKVAVQGKDHHNTLVDQVMNSPVITCEICESYNAALEKMKLSKIRHIIVTENGNLSGIISMRDLLELDIHEKNQTLEMLNNYITR